MSYESSAEPIKIGYLMDFLLPDGFIRRSGHAGVIRQLDPARLDRRGLSGGPPANADGVDSHLVDRFGEE